MQFELRQDCIHDIVRKAFLGCNTKDIIDLIHCDEVLKLINLAYHYGLDDSSRDDETYSKGYRDGHEDGYEEGRYDRD